ncbi:alpha beta-hydrolase [Phaffia rhodozyma]|uniref:Alpha beta-hydrolase n=2 Tax=Phaffia rhodozyma TaxID=264483 RepID=Q9UUP8_PHARH|nr:epoxide hydrolase [Phaffia rhodozyma]CED83938.1 alpha beta-hydrolase [Phaffia rhodozyma]
MTSANIPTPFQVSFAQQDVDRMMAKIRDTRLPTAPIVPGASWDYGIDLDWLTELHKYWANEWSWEETEKRINKYPHFRVDIEEISLHFVHIKSKQPDAIPLILSHGWPSSFLEFWEVIDELVDPTKAGQPAFHVVIPSMPGYTFSSGPQRKGWTVVDTARVYNSLMVNVLGYKTYTCGAGDWGSWITAQILHDYSEFAVVAHFTMIKASVPILNPIYSLPILLGKIPFVPKGVARWLQSLVYTEAEINGLERTDKFWKEGLGYQKIQGSKPMTLGAALFDSPVGILSWIGEKYHGWSDPRAPSAPSQVTPNHIVTVTALYFLTGSIHTSFLPYKEYTLSPMAVAVGKKRPIGLSIFPAEITQYPRSWVASSCKLVNYKVHARGGHFAAVDNPGAYVEDIRETIGKNYHSEL